MGANLAEPIAPRKPPQGMTKMPTIQMGTRVDIGNADFPGSAEYQDA
jgi:hypothetical protein